MDPTKKTIKAIVKDQKVRREVTKSSHLWFFHVYFYHYVKYESAKFHKEIFELTEDPKIENIGIVAFRGSAKSTIMNMSYPIWAILGDPQKKFILLVGQTQQQARQHIKNLKDELEDNELLRADLGPFEEQEEDWRAFTIVIPKYKARITAVSIDQSVRGIRHSAFRPDLIICDDVEDLASVKTKESRDKTFQWLTSELLPAGDKNTRFVMIGNLLHEDSCIMRFKTLIEEEKMNGVFKEYPLITESGQCTWPGKYPDAIAIDKERKRIASEVAWQREFMLNIVTDQDRVIYPEWIRYYDELPETSKGQKFLFRRVGVDLAISQKSSADFTAIVSCQAHGSGPDFKIYILPNIINERLTHLETVDRITSLSEALYINAKPKILVEDVGYQGSVVEQLKREGCYAVGVPLRGQDKRARLSLVSHLVQDGTILFPRKGCEKLIQQLIGFGLERYDDLCDAFSIMLTDIYKEKNRPSLKPIFIYEDEPSYGITGRYEGIGNMRNMQF